MPRYIAPNTDVSRLSFMDKAIETAVAAQNGGVTQRLDAALVAELTAHYNAYKAAYDAAQSALNNRTGETTESAAAMDRLKMFMRHTWTAVHHRTLREGHPARVLGYYRLNSDGTQPTLASRREWLLMADAMLAGEVEAVAAGYAPICCPTAAELQAVRDEARAQVEDAPLADAAYDEAQAAVAALRPEADRLIKEARDMLIFSTRTMDAPSQRRVLRNHGARFYYTPDETIDEGDDTAVVLEEGIE